MTRRIGCRDRFADFRSRKPLRQLCATVSIPLAHLRPRELRCNCIFFDLPDVFVTIFVGQVNKLAKRQDFNANFIFETLDQFLRRIRRIKRFARSSRCRDWRDRAR